MELLERAKSLDVNLAIGLDHALIGLWSPVFNDRIDNQDKTIAVYSIDLIVKRYMEQDGMTYEDGLEFFQYNVVDVFTENHPIFVEE